MSLRCAKLVGHSQGGIVAAQFASDPEYRKEFNVSHVVTAGSPVGNNHGMTTVYRPVGEYLDSSNDPSVQAFRDSAAQFLNGTEVSYSLQTITREVPKWLTAAPAR